MRIVNKEFNDYYDSCMTYGMDEKLVYVRNLEEYSQKSRLYTLVFNELQKFMSYNSRKNNFSSLNCDTSEFKIKSGIIGFCGKLYPYFKIFSEETQQIKYTFDKKFMKAFTIKISKNNSNFFSLNLSLATVESFMSVKINQDLFFKLGNPIFQIDNKKLIINPNLRRYKFYKIINAFTAYQEISIFLGGVLEEAHPPIEKLIKSFYDEK
jgi:hypothetical protein